MCKWLWKGHGILRKNERRGCARANISSTPGVNLGNDYFRDGMVKRWLFISGVETIRPITLLITPDYRIWHPSWLRNVLWGTCHGGASCQARGLTSFYIFYIHRREEDAQLYRACSNVSGGMRNGCAGEGWDVRRWDDMCSSGMRSIELGRFAQQWFEEYYNGKRRSMVGWDALDGMKCPRSNEFTAVWLGRQNVLRLDWIF